ncbi:MAG TPA: DUF47 family protein [Caldilineae bacterium]|nr:DUF47 family protein [Caldilineae bacterium]
MFRLIERSFLLGLGVLTLTKERVIRFVDELVKEGAIKPEESQELVDKLVAKGEEEREELRKLVRQELEKALASITPASRQEIKELNRKLDELATQVEQLAAAKRTKKAV